MIKKENYYQSILQNSTLIIKVSGKICDNQENISNVVENIQKLICLFTKTILLLHFQNHENQNPHSRSPNTAAPLVSE